ncbi:hypothetical protein HN51_020357 [Arachis hypogaea]
MFQYRTGGSENCFHCDKCGCCHSTLLKNSHTCVEKAMHHDCPVCFEEKILKQPQWYNLHEISTLIILRPPYMLQTAVIRNYKDQLVTYVTHN